MGCFATEENTEDDNPPIGINYSRRRFKMKSVTRYFRNAVAASMQGTCLLYTSDAADEL